MAQEGVAETKEALERLPSGLFVMTSTYDGKRAGVVVRSVQPCACDPPLVSVAVRKGHRIEPLIRDSHCFAVCQMDDDDKLVMRKLCTSRWRYRV